MDFSRYERYESLILRIFLGLTLIFWGYEKLALPKLADTYVKDYLWLSSRMYHTLPMLLLRLAVRSPCWFEARELIAGMLSAWSGKDIGQKSLLQLMKIIRHLQHYTQCWWKRFYYPTGRSRLFSVLILATSAISKRSASRRAQRCWRQIAM